MSKFYVGQKVLVTASTLIPCRSSRDMVGKFGFIKDIGLRSYSVWNEYKSDWFGFYPSDLQPITETPETLTINGVEYIRKPEPEHEWKFGDWARHPEYGVVFVGNVNGPDKLWCVVRDEKCWRSGTYLSPKDLTYISSASIPV